MFGCDCVYFLIFLIFFLSYYFEMSTANNEISADSQDDVALENILSLFRPLGPYYRRFMPFLIFATFTNSIYCVNYVLTTVPVDYRCKYDCEDNYRWDGFELNKTLVAGKCDKYHELNAKKDCSVNNFNLTDMEVCNKWVYDEPESFVAEFQLGCQEWKRNLVGTVHSVGHMLGLVLLGPISDKVGRKKLIVFSGISSGVLGISKSVTQSYWAYTILELLEAMLGDVYASTYMLGVEMVAKQNRKYFGPLMIATIAIGGTIFAMIAWLVPYWRLMLRIVYGFTILFIFHAIFLDESVRWLLVKGKKEEAKNILQKAAEISNIDIDEETLDNIESEKSTEDNLAVTKLIKMTVTSKKLLLRFLVCACMWITASFNKYALMINSVSLEGNRYRNYALTAFADLPAAILLVFILTKFKRREPLICTFLVTGLFCVVQSLLPKGYSVLSVALFFIGKLAASQSYGLIYLYTSELFPTYTRNTMHSVCSSLGRIGSILATQSPLLRQVWPGLPSVIIGSLSLITGVIIMLMPETCEDVLPDTIKEAEALGMKTIRDRKVVDKLLK